MLLEVTGRNNFLLPLKEDLRQMIDSDFGLPTILMNRQVLTNEERLSVKSDANKNFLERNDVLLNILLRKDSAAQRRFISCLHETEQDHVCYFINCDGGK